ncbi:MAG: type II toxin-antitoxin system RelE/ParE family toxin [Gallionella sp.]|nr:type II toxin-antitoxin system RelE/ParE family toxin [Gallionella sp.]
MKTKQVIPHELADRDVEDVVDYYLQEAGDQVALGFIESLEKAYTHISRHPQTGSLRYAHELDLPGLRMWPLKRYPYLVFYIEQVDQIDVWRVLNSQRDIPAWLRDESSIATK